VATVDEHGTLAELLHQLHGVSGQDDSHVARLELLHPHQALVLEVSVTYRQHLIHQHTHRAALTHWALKIRRGSEPFGLNYSSYGEGDNHIEFYGPPPVWRKDRPGPRILMGANFFGHFTLLCQSNRGVSEGFPGMILCPGFTPAVAV